MGISRYSQPAIWAYIFQRLVTWYPLRSIAIKIMIMTKPQHATCRGQSMELCNELNKNGVVLLPKYVELRNIEDIKKHLNGLTLMERFSERRSGFTLENVPKDVHVAEYATKDILSCQTIIDIANHPELIDAAAQYLGCKPTISNISIWWSFPTGENAQEAENYHRDVDDFRFVKFFLYMTDVDENSGPHCFVRGSHRSTKFLKIRRLTDNEVEQNFQKEDRLTIKGKIGDAFLEDTFGLHKGTPPKNSRRLVLQVQYSINPIAVYEYESVENNYLGIDAYVNRLFLKKN